MSPKRIIVGISGASGAIYGIRALEMLRDVDVEPHVVVSRSAELTLRDELDLNIKDLETKCDTLHAIRNVGATIASGSYHAMGMLIAPCSVRTLSEIVTGVTSSLLTRAADVQLKERRPLVLMVRETPLHLGHLRSMTAAAEMGAIIAPPMPAFYSKPEDLNEMVSHNVGRVLDIFGIEVDIKRWAGLGSNGQSG